MKVKRDVLLKTYLAMVHNHTYISVISRKMYGIFRNPKERGKGKSFSPDSAMGSKISETKF